MCAGQHLECASIRSADTGAELKCKLETVQKGGHSGPGARAPAIDVICMQGIAGFFAQRGFFGAAVMVLTGRHCCLRTGELLELRTGDFQF